MFFPPALIIQHASTNSRFYRKELFSYFHLLAMLRIIMQYSLVKLVVD